MLPEIFLLALASTVRPTSLAAVSALLAQESRRRLMFAYVVAGLAVTLLFGVVVLTVFHGVHIHAGSDRTKAIADLVGGVAALLFGLAVLTGVVSRRSDPRAGRSEARLDAAARSPDQRASGRRRRSADPRPRRLLPDRAERHRGPQPAVAGRPGRYRDLQRDLVRAADRGARDVHRRPGS